jgi:hypothetical protein
MAVDPAQSFSNALGQGLGIMKSYRDEARLDEETTFNRKIALSAEERSKNAEQRAQQNQSILVEQNEYEKVRRPFKEKVEQTQLTGFELNNQGQQQQNEWYPKIQAENIRSSKDSSARGWAQVGLERQRFNLAAAQAADERAERQERSAFRSLVQAVQTNDYSVVENNPKVSTAILRMAGAASGAPALLQAMQNPTGDWLKNPQTKRAVLNVAALDLGKTADNLGYKRGSVSVLDIRPSKTKGQLAIDFIGVNPKTGRLEKRVGEADAARVFDKTAVFANTMFRITNDPKSRAAMVRAFRSSVPDEYGEMVQYEVGRREKMIKGISDGTVTVDDPERAIVRLNDEIDRLSKGDPNVTGAILFPRIEKAGREYVQSSTTRAYEKVEGRAVSAKGNPDAIVKGINGVIDRAARDPKFYAAILKKAGISSAGGFDANKVLKAIGR